MRTTLILDEHMLLQAIKATGVKQKTKLIHMGLEALIQKAAQSRLAKLYGSVKKAKAPQRRKLK